MSIIRKETIMIKATISTTTGRNAFAKAGGKRIARAVCSDRKTVRGLVLDKYKLVASGVCSDKELVSEVNNVILFKKQREVA